MANDAKNTGLINAVTIVDKIIIALQIYMPDNSIFEVVFEYFADASLNVSISAELFSKNVFPSSQ